jgi:hypothetical protein
MSLTLTPTQFGLYASTMAMLGYTYCGHNEPNPDPNTVRPVRFRDGHARLHLLRPQ